jgi:hypothetical protein
VNTGQLRCGGGRTAPVRSGITASRKNSSNPLNLIEFQAAYPEHETAKPTFYARDLYFSTKAPTRRNYFTERAYLNICSELS